MATDNNVLFKSNERLLDLMKIIKSIIFETKINILPRKFALCQNNQIPKCYIELSMITYYRFLAFDTTAVNVYTYMYRKTRNHIFNLDSAHEISVEIQYFFPLGCNNVIHRRVARVIYEHNERVSITSHVRVTLVFHPAANRNILFTHIYNTNIIIYIIVLRANVIT